MANRCCVESKKEGPKNRPLGDTSSKWSRFRAVISYGDMLRTVSEIGGNKRESRVREAKSRREPG